MTETQVPIDKVSELVGEVYDRFDVDRSKLEFKSLKPIDAKWRSEIIQTAAELTCTDLKIDCNIAFADPKNYTCSYTFDNEKIAQLFEEQSFSNLAKSISIVLDRHDENPNEYSKSVTYSSTCDHLSVTLVY